MFKNVFKIMVVGVIIIGTLNSNNIMVSGSEFRSIEDIINTLPTKVMEIVNNNNIVYGEDSDKYIDEYEAKWNMEIAGYFEPKNNTIYLKSYRYDSQDYIKKNWYELTLLHEIGHLFDYNADGKFSDTYEFFNYYALEKDNFKDVNGYEYLISSQLEYFAKCFSYYFLDDTTNTMLKDLAPKTYEYIKNITK